MGFALCLGAVGGAFSESAENGRFRQRTKHRLPGILRVMTTVPSFTPVRITLAGRVIPDAADMVIAYLEGRTNRTQERIYDFDYAAQRGRVAFLSGSNTRRITQKSIDSANKLRARMGYGYRGEGSPLSGGCEPREGLADWSRITPAHTFIAADPNHCGGIYDDYCAIWYNFFPPSAVGQRIGIGPAKVNKILHQLYPDLFPIFDGNLHSLYFKGSFSTEANDICAKVIESRDLAQCPSAYGDTYLYEPLRLDMAAISRDDYEEIRRQVSTRPCENSHVIEKKSAQKWAAENLSDVRLIDMIAWQL